LTDKLKPLRHLVPK